MLARPLISVLAAGGLLVALSVPALGMELKAPGTEGISRSEPIMRTLDRLDAAFPGRQPAGHHGDQGQGRHHARGPDRHQGAARQGDRHRPPVGALSVEISPDKTVAIVSLAVEGKGTDAASNRSLEVLRDEVVPATVGKLANAEVAVSGVTAWSKDFLDTMKSHLPIVFGFVLSARVHPAAGDVPLAGGADQGDRAQPAVGRRRLRAS